LPKIAEALLENYRVFKMWDTYAYSSTGTT
jgi:hypothetical protein